MIYALIIFVCILLMIIFGGIAYVNNDSGNEALVGVSVIITVVAILTGGITYGFCMTKPDRNPKLKHELLQKNIVEAEKELQKFYIDHPEFKETEE